MDQKTFKDDYEHYLSDETEYILENILQDDDGSNEFKELSDLYNSTITKVCQCKDESCENCDHGGNYIFKKWRIVVKRQSTVQGSYL